MSKTLKAINVTVYIEVNSPSRGWTVMGDRGYHPPSDDFWVSAIIETRAANMFGVVSDFSPISPNPIICKKGLPVDIDPFLKACLLAGRRRMHGSITLADIYNSGWKDWRGMPCRVVHELEHEMSKLERFNPRAILEFNLREFDNE